MNHEKRSKKLGENVLVVVSVILVGITLYGLWLIYSVWKDKPHEIAELQHVDFEAPVIDGVTYLPADDGEIGPENCAAPMDRDDFGAEPTEQHGRNLIQRVPQYKSRRPESAFGPPVCVVLIRTGGTLR